jgi:hypothetical protein
MPHELQIKPESIALMQALLARTAPAADAREAFRHAYPAAPAEMINSAVFHVISDGLGAVVDWLAAVETFLREPKPGGPSGSDLWHVVYHLYNWQQFQALLPVGRADLLEALENAKRSLESDADVVSAIKAVNEVIARLHGSATPPRVE